MMGMIDRVGDDERDDAIGLGYQGMFRGELRKV